MKSRCASLSSILSTLNTAHIVLMVFTILGRHCPFLTIHFLVVLSIFSNLPLALNWNKHLYQGMNHHYHSHLPIYPFGLLTNLLKNCSFTCCNLIRLLHVRMWELIAWETDKYHINSKYLPPHCYLLQQVYGIRLNQHGF